MTAESRGVALVTGAASGIGRQIAARLAGAGWRTTGLDLERSDTDLPVQADVTDPSAVEAAVARAEAELGPVSVLVTAAGVYDMVPVGEIDAARWRRMLELHLGGTVNACRAVLPGMLAAGEGVIVTVSSELAISGGNGDAHYVAAKGAVIGLTRSLGAELAPHGIRVNSVAPGPTDTPLLAPDSPSRDPAYLATLPLGRLVSPDEVADTVRYLVEEGSYFAGQVVSPNAGAVI